MKYSIITACFGGYDTFKEPDVLDPDCEYIYVTDNPNLKSKKWKIALLDKKYKNKSSLWKAFYVRYHLQEFTNRGIAIWVDASVQIHKSLRPIVDKFIKSQSDICCPILWRSINTFGVVEHWRKHFKGNPHKIIKDSSYKKVKNYVAKTVGLKYRGHAEANFQIVKLRNIRVSRLRAEIWRDILKYGSDGNPFRVDEVMLSVKLQTKFRSLKVFKVTRQILMSSYMSFISHNGKNIGRGYDPNRMCKSSLYFYNSPQKINIFL